MGGGGGAAATGCDTPQAPLRLRLTAPPFAPITHVAPLSRLWNSPTAHKKGAETACFPQGRGRAKVLCYSRTATAAYSVPSLGAMMAATRTRAAIEIKPAWSWKYIGLMAVVALVPAILTGLGTWFAGEAVKDRKIIDVLSDMSENLASLPDRFPVSWKSDWQLPPHRKR